MNTELKFIPVGYGNAVCANRIACILKKKGTVTNRRYAEAKQKNQIIDLTQGRATRSLLLLDNGKLVETALTPQTILGRINAKDELLQEAARQDAEDDAEDEGEDE